MFTENEKIVIAQAAEIIETKIRTTSALTSPDLAIELCTKSYSQIWCMSFFASSV